MAKIAFFSIPAHGHINPTLPLVRELTRRGHAVRYYAYQPFREKIEAAGAECILCDSYDAQLQLTKKEASRIGSDMALSIRVLVDTTLSLKDMVLNQMAAWQPDAIVFDSMAPWGKLAAQTRNIPCLCSNTTFAFNRHSARVMKQGPGDLLKMLLAMPKMGRDIQRLRASGFLVKGVLDLIAADETIPTIVYTSREFQPAGETFGEGFFFAGPLLRQPEEPSEKAQVYVSMGTVNNEMLPLYRACTEALAGKTAILSVGQAVDPAALGPLPEGIRAYPRVDQVAVLSQAEVFLTHCGMNSVSEALWFGVPLVMNPKTKEQQGVANRVCQLGAGILLKSEDPTAIRTAIDTVLSDPSYRKTAQTIAKTFQKSPGSPGAADFIEKNIR